MTYHERRFIMKYFLVLVQTILFGSFTIAQNQEQSNRVPCPFASISSEHLESLIRSHHKSFHVGDESNSDGSVEFVFSLDSFDEVENESSVVAVVEPQLKGQLTAVIHPDEYVESIPVKKRMLRNKERKRDRAKNNTKGRAQRLGCNRRKGNKCSEKKRNKRGGSRKRTKRGKRNKEASASSSLTRCFSEQIYDSIDDDIAKLKKSIRDDVPRSHFLGGIVRLAAHDFMDFDRRDRANPMGSDGCFDPMHNTNVGLPESVWCKTCLLRSLYEAKYSSLSRADFWIASANAVIRQTSKNNAMDLRDTFRWGRKDRKSCIGSADRLPDAKGCKDVEHTFLTRMGLEWKDAVALLGAHSLGRGNLTFSGHEGTWVDNAADAQEFNKQYYDELVFNAWLPRNIGRDNQDWTTAGGIKNPRLMLNTDICLVFDIDSDVQCCTKSDEFFPNGQSKCMDFQMQCPLYSKQDSRRAATEAVVEYIGSRGSRDNGPFYNAFSAAWRKATTNGWSDLSELSDTCDEEQSI